MSQTKAFCRPVSTKFAIEPSSIRLFLATGVDIGTGRLALQGPLPVGDVLFFYAHVVQADSPVPFGIDVMHQCRFRLDFIRDVVRSCLPKL